MRYTHIRIELLPWQWKITSFLMHREKIWDIRIVLLPWQRSKYLMNLYEIWYYFSPNYYVRFMSEMHLSHIHDTHVHEYISFASCLCTTHNNTVKNIHINIVTIFTGEKISNVSFTLRKYPSLTIYLLGDITEKRC